MDKLLVGLRLDTPTLAIELDKRFQLVPFPQTASPTLQDYHIPSIKVMGVDIAAFVAQNWNVATAAIAMTHRLIDEHKPVGCVLWNTVTPQHAAIALTCRSRGVPVFEVCHWAIATYLIGHFEDVSLADHVFCSPEHAEFAALCGRPATQYITTGRPQYDHWQREDRYEVRKRLGLPEDGPYVLVTSTWTHYLTEWSGPEWNASHQVDVLNTLRYFQKASALRVLWSVRGQSTPEQMGQRLAKAGLDAFVTNDTAIQDLINAADIVVTQKSGVISDSIVLHRPVIAVDYHPQSDSWAWKDKGAFHARSPYYLARCLSRLLRNEKLCDAVTARQAKYDAHFGWTGDASTRIADRMVKLCESSS